MLVTKVRADMVTALKNGEKDKKTILAMLVAALDKAAKEKKADLTEDEEIQVVRKMCKQIVETIDTCPAERGDIKAKAEMELAAIQGYAPAMMSAEDIATYIAEVLHELGIEDPTPQDKGRIMKALMPKVKGKADGKVVNVMVEAYLKG